MGKRILIVEDEAAVRRLMTRALEASGYDVTVAADGRTGLELFGDGAAWSLVLLDQRMPGMDGLTILARLKERAPAALVVMVTAFASIEMAVEAMKLGAVDFLRKPLMPETLRAAVAAALRGRPASAPPIPHGAPPARPEIETLTMNGFRFVSEAENGSVGVYRFRVFAGTDTGHGAPVSVAIDPAAVARVERISGRRLPASSSFWRTQAENLLAAYLWTEQHIPEPERLRVRDVSREDMDAAAAWSE